MESTDKNSRDQKILDLHNSGNSVSAIAKETGMSKGGVHKILNKHLVTGEVAPKKPVEVKLTGKEERFTSFVGYERQDVNVYKHKETGEVVKVAYVKAESIDTIGYFVKLND